MKKMNRNCPANVFAYIFGSVSAIIMGSGMSLAVVLCLAGSLPSVL